MFPLTIWDVLGIISIICLGFSFFNNSVGIQGSLIMGMSISIIFIIITRFKDGATNWALIKHILIVFVLLGTLLEIKIRIKRRKLKQNPHEK